MRQRLIVAMVLALSSAACGRSAIVGSALPLKRVVIYRNGVGYFERGGQVDEAEVKFKMRDSEVGDFLATLAVIEKGGSSVKAAAFPLRDDTEDPKPRSQMTSDEKNGLKTVVLSLDGKEHDLQVGYVAESPVWKPSYRVVVRPNGQADLQVWGIVVARCRRPVGVRHATRRSGDSRPTGGVRWRRSDRSSSARRNLARTRRFTAATPHDHARARSGQLWVFVFRRPDATG
jgi:hypothetical protein